MTVSHLARRVLQSSPKLGATTDDIIFKNRCLQNLEGPKGINFLPLLNQILRLIDEASEFSQHALKIPQAIQYCVNRFAPEKARKFKQVTCKMKFK